MVVAPRYLNGTKSDKLYESSVRCVMKSKVGCLEVTRGWLPRLKTASITCSWTILRAPSAGSLYSDPSTKPLAITSSDTRC